MNLVALLSFYDENPDWLDRCVASLKLLPVNRVIAVDGAYKLFPGARRDSHPDQHTAIRDACTRNGMLLSTFVPTVPWDGEVEKRNHLFRMAEETGADWYFVIDSDEFVTHAPSDVHERLGAAPFDVGAVTLKEPGHPLGTIVYPTHPKFFRAIPGLRAVRNHYTYTTPDGRKLWGNAKTDHLEPRADLTGIVVEHHKELRHPDRRKRANDYYEERDALGVEDLPKDRSLLKGPA